MTTVTPVRGINHIGESRETTERILLFNKGVRLENYVVNGLSGGSPLGGLYLQLLFLFDASSFMCPK